MPINPNFKTKWRPDKDLARCHTISHINEEDFVPKSSQEAISYILGLSLDDIVCYKNYPVEKELVEEEAKRRYPALFNLAPLNIANSLSDQPNEDIIDAYFKGHKKVEGSLDWPQIVKDTTYIVYISN